MHIKLLLKFNHQILKYEIGSEIEVKYEIES